MSIAWDWQDHHGETSVSDRAERALLGAILMTGDLDLDRIERLRPEDFRSSHRGAVLSAMRRLAFRKVPIDATSLAHELERGKVAPPPDLGWVGAVDSLLESFIRFVRAVDDVLMDEWARIVSEAAILRRRSAWRS